MQILYVYVYIFRKSTEAELLSLHVLTLSHNPFACLCPTTGNADALKVRNLSSKILKVFSIWPQDIPPMSCLYQFPLHVFGRLIGQLILDALLLCLKKKKIQIRAEMTEGVIASYVIQQYDSSRLFSLGPVLDP